MAKKKMTPIARKLRRSMTEAEKLLWSNLRGSQLENSKFVRQFPIGRAVVDFACRSAKLAIELDGGQHSENEADEARTQLIEAHGYQVIRFWNNEVFENMNGVLEAISQALLNARNH
ncbi:MAG: hypothetical protein Pars2KO_29860 [Parasphingorhabdus sp.]